MKKNRAVCMPLLFIFIFFAHFSHAASAAQGAPCAGKNLIFIQLESFQNFPIGRSLNGAELTPNLNVLVHEGLWFSRCYPQTAGGNTSDAEFLANTSLLPLAHDAVFKHYTGGKYASLANTLAKKGYRTAVFHGNVPNVWNRPAMYPALGFARYDASSQYSERARVEKIGLGIADGPFYAETLSKLETLGEPFFAAVISLSSHHPFKIPDSIDSFDSGPYTGTIFGDYLRAIHYADRTLGAFIAGLRASGLMERSLVVIYGDHGGVPIEEYSRMRHFLFDTEVLPPAGTAPPNPALWREMTQVPLLFLANGADGTPLAGMSNAPVGQVDIAATVAGLMGLMMPQAAGTDLLEKNPPFVLFRQGSLIKGSFWITNTTGQGTQVYDLTNGKLLFAGPEGQVFFSQTIEKARQVALSSDRLLEPHRSSR